MTAGDLVTKKYRYEFRDYLFGSGRPFLVERVTGLLSLPEARTHDMERMGEHGDFPGEIFMAARTVEIDGRLLGLPGIDIEHEIAVLSDAFLPTNDHHPLVFLRPGQQKRFVAVRVHKRDIPSVYDTAKGKASVSLMLKADDPRIYSIVRYQTMVTIADGQSSAQGNVVNNGNFDTYPTFEITGPCTNPRVKHVGLDRTIRIDMTIPSGQTLVIDVRTRTLTIGSVNHDDKVRSDNQWFALPRGVSTITYNRTGTTDSSAMKVLHRDAWA